MSEYEYPTDEQLERVAKWEFGASSNSPLGEMGFKAYLAHIKGLWWMPDWGWHEYASASEFGRRPVTVYHISTGGWSGNESLIEAMERNWLFMSMCWMESHRGGHYRFEVKHDAEQKK